MKKLLIAIVFLLPFVCNSQVIHTIDVSDVTVDSVYYFDSTYTSYNTSYGLTIKSTGITGTSGTIRLLNSSSLNDTLIMSNTGGFSTVTITNDSLYGRTTQYLPMKHAGIWFLKETLTAGEIEIKLERKTRK